MPFLTDQWYNPSSGYRAAKTVRKALEVAHEQVAALINAKPEEIVFTGCGTESNNALLTFLAFIEPLLRCGTDSDTTLTSSISFLIALSISIGRMLKVLPADVPP